MEPAAYVSHLNCEVMKTLLGSRFLLTSLRIPTDKDLEKQINIQSH